MPDNGTGGDPTQGTQPMGGGTDPNADPSGGDPTHGDSTAVDMWGDEQFRKDQLSGKFRDGYGKGRQKGQQDGVISVLKRFGVSSVEELEARLSIDETTPEPPVPQPTAQPAAALTQAPTPEVESKAMREARLARQKLEREYAEQKAAMEKLEARASRALRGELRSRLVQAGAHEGVDELVTLLVDAEKRFGWAGDGQDIVAFERMDDGSLHESGQSIDEAIAEVQKKRPWYFKGEPRQGSGYQGNPKPQPKPPSATWDYRRNLEEWNARRRG